MTSKAGKEFSRQAEEAAKGGDHSQAAYLYTQSSIEHNKAAERSIKWAIVALGVAISAQIIGLIARILANIL